MFVAYVAGPYRSEAVYDIEQNIQRAKRLAVELWKRGYAVICPHANSAFMDGACDDETFLEGGLELLRRSDFVVALNGWESSKGTRKELELAKSLGIPIYFEKKLAKGVKLGGRGVAKEGDGISLRGQNMYTEGKE